MLAMTTTGTIDGIRAYFRELRTRQSISQKDLADQMRLSERAYLYWETGETKELKSGPLVRAAAYLHASLDQIRHLIDTQAPEDEGKRLAQEWLAASSMSSEERQHELTAIYNELAELDEMREELENRPGLLTEAMNFLRFRLAQERERDTINETDDRRASKPRTSTVPPKAS